MNILEEIAPNQVLKLNQLTNLLKRQSRNCVSESLVEECEQNKHNSAEWMYGGPYLGCRCVFIFLAW